MLIFLLLSWVFYLQAVGPDASNPHANFWRVVRQGIPGFTTVSSEGHKVLILNSGENWREIRNGLIMRASQWIILLALFAMALFYIIVGKDRLEKPRSGIKIERFTLPERILHWYTALAFILMAITGLSMLLGRLLLMPVFGHWFVSVYIQGAKTLHNYCGPLLLAGIFVEMLSWMRYNIPSKADLQWFRNMGGMLGGPRASRRQNQRRRKGMVLACLPIRRRRGDKRHIARFSHLGTKSLHHATIPCDPREPGGVICYCLLRPYIRGNDWHRRRI